MSVPEEVTLNLGIDFTHQCNPKISQVKNFKQRTDAILLGAHISCLSVNWLILSKTSFSTY